MRQDAHLDLSIKHALGCSSVCFFASLSMTHALARFSTSCLLHMSAAGRCRALDHLCGNGNLALLKSTFSKPFPLISSRVVATEFSACLQILLSDSLFRLFI